MTTAHRMLPLYEAKMIHHFDHRWATHDGNDFRDVTAEEKADDGFVALPRYWVRESVAEARVPEAKDPAGWLVGFRDIARNTDERTVISSLFPASAAGNNLPLVFGSGQPRRLAAVLSSFALDFVARPKVGGVHLNFFIVNQIPVLPPETFEEPCSWAPGDIGSWVDRRVDELIERWEPERRPHLRAELDAAMFHLYGIEDRDDVDYILGTFPIVNRKDVAQYGEERTRRLILENYDAMAEAARTGEPFVSVLDPPPGEGPRHPGRDGNDA